MRWLWGLLLATTPLFADDGGCAPGIGPIDSSTPSEAPVLETTNRPALDQALPRELETATFGLG
ncbi:MAG: hypothetical protein R3F62_28045 [Planctomycetota bacterium]